MNPFTARTATIKEFPLNSNGKTDRNKIKEIPESFGELFLESRSKGFRWKDGAENVAALATWQLNELKRPLEALQEDRHRGAAEVGGGQVRGAIAVEVGQSDPDGTIADSQRHLDGSLK